MRDGCPCDAGHILRAISLAVSRDRLWSIGLIVARTGDGSLVTHQAPAEPERRTTADGPKKSLQHACHDERKSRGRWEQFGRYATRAFLEGALSRPCMMA